MTDVEQLKTQTKLTFDTIGEQRGMHCMWIETSDMKEDIAKKD